MKQFFSKNGIWILAAVAVVVVVLCIISAVGNGFLRNPFGIIAKPFRSAGTAVTQWVGGIRQHFDQIEDLQAENEQLRRQIAELEQQVRDQQSESVENQRLRNLLKLHEQRTDLHLEDATIIEHEVSNWFSGFTLNKGTRQDISEGNCVIDTYGNLVGIVTEAGANWCNVTTLLDTSSQLGALIFRTDTTAVAKGSLSLLTGGRLMLTYLDGTDDLLNGDLIVTSGLGGYYPAGLPIGIVEELRTDDSGMSRYAVLSPSTNLNALTQVFVITDFAQEG